MLDLKNGYWKVPIREDDKHKTAFRTSDGQLYEFCQVSFALCDAPETFSNLMDHVLASLNRETWLFYIDEIIVFSKAWEEHLQWLEEAVGIVCQKCRTHCKLPFGNVA